MMWTYPSIQRKKLQIRQYLSLVASAIEIAFSITVMMLQSTEDTQLWPCKPIGFCTHQMAAYKLSQSLPSEIPTVFCLKLCPCQIRTRNVSSASLQPGPSGNHFVFFIRWLPEGQSTKWLTPAFSWIVAIYLSEFLDFKDVYFDL